MCILSISESHLTPSREARPTPGVALGSILRVRCVDNTLQQDLLHVGCEYDAVAVSERDDYYELSGLGRFSRSRFEIA